MADRRTTPEPAHRGHDVELVAAWAVGDATPAQGAAAVSLVASCNECRQLIDDIRGLRAAIRGLPAPVRRRDFRLSAETAARLRPASRWDRFRLGLVASGGFGRPLAASLMTLGLAGLLVSAAPLLPGGVPLLAQRDTTTSLAAPESNFAAGGAAPQAAGSGATDAGTTTSGAAGSPGPGAKSITNPSPLPFGGPAAVAVPPDAPGASADPGRGPAVAPLPSPPNAGAADRGAVPLGGGNAVSGPGGAPIAPVAPGAVAPSLSSLVAIVSALTVLAGAALLVARRRAAGR